VKQSAAPCRPIRGFLSSKQTFWTKVIFPTLWIGGFAAGTLVMFLQPGQDSAAPPPPIKWIFLTATIAGAAFLYWTCMRLKQVRMDDQALYISNYLREIRVPLQQVEEVSENRWVNIHPVTIDLRDESELGRRIVFMPKVRWFALWSSHPVVKEIREAAERAGAAFRT